jgi:outer membrane lipopolysaccharide assembly protein LptE/RlpB
MEQISIKVGAETAKKWQNADPKIKMQVEKSFEKQIQTILKNSTESDFDIILKEIREEAAKNGLTPEILQEILNEE